jgi:uncharacterized membrane protein YidH (DUF202 family)
VTPRIPRALKQMPGADAVAVAIMFVFTVFGWYLFRETSLTRIGDTLTRNPFVASHEQWIAATVMVAVALVMATPLLVAHAALRWVVPRIERSEWYLPIQTASWAIYAAGMFVFVRMSSADFIYFQF